MLGLIKEVEMETEVDIGGINALKCDIIMKSMENTQKNILKNIEKVKKFSKEASALTYSRSSSSQN